MKGGEYSVHACCQGQGGLMFASTTTVYSPAAPKRLGRRMDTAGDFRQSSIGILPETLQMLHIVEYIGSAWNWRSGNSNSSC